MQSCFRRDAVGALAVSVSFVLLTVLLPLFFLPLCSNATLVPRWLLLRCGKRDHCKCNLGSCVLSCDLSHRRLWGLLVFARTDVKDVRYVIVNPLAYYE